MITRHFRISGLVQGVGFRYFVLQRARLLGVRGHVRNLATGEVAVVAQGERAQVEALLDDLRVGPRSAHVLGVRVDPVDDEQLYDSFEIRP